jgi:hypothetical protein
MRTIRPEATGCNPVAGIGHNGGPSWLELESVKSLAEVSEITSLSEDTITRRYPELIVHLSPRRRGMKVRNILKITNGEAV